MNSNQDVKVSYNAIPNITSTVKSQYEDLPYPFRKPEEEKERMLSVPTSNLDYINHTCYEGGRDFSKPFRVLVVGGGTGDIDVFWAENMRDNPNSEIVSIDLSTASQSIAKERLKTRGLEGKVRHINDSLFNLPNYNLGEFDFINCTGVLHHTENPTKGLQTLASLSKEDGILDIMVYGQHGRYGIYPLQNILKIINQDTQDKQEKVDNAYKLLNTLPQSNYFAQNLKDMGSIPIPNELYDLLLHDQDRAYTVPQVYEMADDAGLKLISFFSMNGMSANDDYLPEKYINDPQMREYVRTLPLRQRQEIAETMNSKMKMHFFYLSKAEKKSIQFGLDVIPDFTMRFGPNTRKVFIEMMAKPDDIITVTNGMVKVKFKKTPHLEAIFNNLNGERTLREILEIVQKESSTSANLDDLAKEFKAVYDIFNNQYWMFLRQPHIPRYTTRTQMQERVNQMYA